ncbi:MAG TPA: amino acid adenylation domain-containing protein, partial [Longimicrobium sp.]|nr:amino acid adenylation domain-containing protein [Longimicrobium sp.]
VPRGGPLPASFAQERMWLLDQLEPGSAAYNMPGALRLAGEVDAAVLERALGEVAARHEALRTRFAVVDGRPMQVVEPPAPFALPVRDLRALAPAEAGETAAALAAAEAAEPFDLARGPLFRARLLRVAEAEWLLLVTLHPAVGAGGSLEVLLRELAALYAAFREGRPSPLAPPAAHYADWAAWQRARLTDDALAPHLAYWKGRLAGLAPVLELPTDRPRPPVSGTAQGRHAFALPAGAAGRLRALAREEGATVFMAALAAFSALLGRWAATDDVAVGTAVDGRTLAETEGMIGVFVNTLVLRADLSGRPTAREMVRRARAAVLEAGEHAELPFERLVDAVGAERSLAHAPLFGALLAVRPAGALRVDLPGIEARVEEGATAAAKFDLSLLLVEEEGGGMRGTLSYRADLFDPATAARMAAQLERIVAGMGEGPDAPVGAVSLLDDADRALLAACNDTAAELPPACIHEVLAAHAARAPEAPAAEHTDGVTAFGEMESRANRLARRLLALGVGAEARVGICLEQGPEALVAMLAAWKAGGAWVPLDPALPAERLAYLVRDSGARLVLTREGLMDRLPAGAPALALDAAAEREAAAREDDGPVDVAADPGRLAYVVYTSGSTGAPKGVMVEHGSLANYLAWAARTLVDASAPLPVVTALAFDAWLKQMLAPLSLGLPAWFPGEVAARPAALLEALASRPRVSVNCVPALWSAALDALEGGEGPRPAGLARVVLSGDAPDAALVERTRALFPGVEVWNVYGPTEATANACGARLEPGGPVHLGRPVDNLALWVVDAGGEPLPVGIAGELCIGGAGVARGYLGRPGLTAEKFVPDPFSSLPGARMYRSGDRFRRLEDGSPEFLGRLDRQVKVRGVRVELEEVERCLRAGCELAGDVAVVLAGDQLVACVTPEGADV